jgi:hypothetical protein
MAQEPFLHFNGVAGDTGNYLMSPLSVEQVAGLIKGPSGGVTAGAAAEVVASPADPSFVDWVRRAWSALTGAHLGLPYGIDPASVRQAGWGVVFHEQEADAVKRALQPLIDHRRRGVDAGRVHVLAYTEGQSVPGWLDAHGVSTGNQDPAKVPYYLLLVGDPNRIPFSFCHQLDIEYAVGYLHFDTPEEYERYARSVVSYETGVSVPTALDALFFGTRQDPATTLSADLLVQPLADASLTRYRKTVLIGEDATKSALQAALTSVAGRPPAVALTATHGLAWPCGSPQQLSTQGALICQDWEPHTVPASGDRFAAEDVPPHASVHGMIAFHFACYSAGTPSTDRFLHKPGSPPPAIAPRAFIAALPKALLAHRNGGALACVGHVERAWGYSFATRRGDARLVPFQNLLARLDAGEPLGHAVKDFNERYATLSASLATMLEKVGYGLAVDDRALAQDWIERNDAEGYIVVGDPAVALRTAASGPVARG